MYSSIYRVQSSTRRLPIRALFGFTLKLVESYLSPSPQSLCVVVCPWCLPWVTSVNQAGEGEITYRGHARIAQPPGNNSKCLHRVHRTRCQRGHIKFIPTNVSRTREDRNTQLGCVIVFRSIWRPKKRIRKLNKLTFEYRMQGEPWCDVEDHG